MSILTNKFYYLFCVWTSVRMLNFGEFSFFGWNPLTLRKESKFSFNISYYTVLIFFNDFSFLIDMTIFSDGHWKLKFREFSFSKRFEKNWILSRQISSWRGNSKNILSTFKKKIISAFRCMSCFKTFPFESQRILVWYKIVL